MALGPTAQPAPANEKYNPLRPPKVPTLPLGVLQRLPFSQLTRWGSRHFARTFGGFVGAVPEKMHKLVTDPNVLLSDKPAHND